MDSRGGTITWYLDGDDDGFDRASTRVQAKSRATARSVDRDSTNIARSIQVMVNRSKGHWREFHRNVSRSADLFRDWQTVTRGAQLNSFVLSIIAATGAITELGGALLSASKTLAVLPAGIAGVVTIFAALKIATNGLGDAFEAVAEGDAEALNEAMKKLGPQAQGLVKEFQKLNETFKPIQNGMREAFSTGAASALATINGHIGQFRAESERLARQLGESTKLYAENIAQSDIMKNSIGLANDVMTIFNNSISDQVGLFDSLIKVGDDYIVRLANWTTGLLAGLNATLKTEEGQAKLNSAIEKGIGALQLMGDLIGAVGEFLLELFAVSEEAGVSFIGILTDAFKEMTAFLKTPEGRDQVIQFFQVAGETLKTFLGVLGSITVIILEVTSAFNGLDGPVKDVVLQFFAWAAILGPFMTYISANIMLFKGMFWAIRAVSGIVMQVGGFFKVLAGVVAGPLGKAFSWLAVNVLPKIVGFFTGIGGWLARLAPMFTFLGSIIARVFAGPVGWISIIITLLAGLFAWLYNNVEGFRSFIDGVVKGVGDIFNNIGKWFGEAATNVANFFTALGTAIGNFFAPYINGITQVFTTIWNIISNIFIAIVAIFAMTVEWLFTTFITPVINAFNGLWAMIIEGANIFIATTKAVIGAITDWINTYVITPVVGFFTWMWNHVMEGATIFSNFVQQMFNALVGWINETFITPLVNYFNYVWNHVSNGATIAVNAIKSVFKTVSSWIDTYVVKPVTGFFNGLWNSMARGVTDAINTIKNAISGMVSIAKVPINGIIDLVNSAIGGLNKLKVPDWVPGLGGSSPNIPKIPRLATGGIIQASQGGTMAVIGEGGEDEAVIPLSKLDRMLGNTTTNNNNTGVTINQTNEIYSEVDMDQVNRNLSWELGKL